jgi:DNA-binding transcriptional LysR family regulator
MNGGMDLRHLRTFIAVADQGTVSKAALRLRIAQPALSRQISALEQELGLMLFDRVGRRLVLTGEGEQLLEDCRNLLGQADFLKERAGSLRGGDSGVLKVAATPHQIESLLSIFLNRYAERYPKVEVKLFEAFGPAQLDLLERGEVHLGLRSPHTDDSHLGSYPLPPTGASRCGLRPPPSGINDVRFQSMPRAFANHSTSICARSARSHDRLIHDYFVYRERGAKG